jgi:hypothetical protein
LFVPAFSSLQGFIGKIDFTFLHVYLVLVGVIEIGGLFFAFHFIEKIEEVYNPLTRCYMGLLQLGN